MFEFLKTHGLIMMRELDEKELDEYKQRHKEWRDISLTQLSNVNNVFITLSTGLLIFLTEKEDNNFLIKISILLLGISTLYGIGVLFSRLYDFRISRHLVLCRQRLYDKQNRKTFPDRDLGNYNFCNRLGELKKILFCKIDFIKHSEIKNCKDEQDLKNKFNKLREIADILGTATWLWTKYQVLFFLLSAIIYFTTQIIKF